MNQQVFELVENKEQSQRFFELWKRICNEKEFEEDLDSDYLKRYIFKNKEGLDIGTLQLIEYHPEQDSVLNDFFPFYELEEVQQYPDRLLEVDKVSIAEEYRGQQHLNTILSVILKNAEVHNVKYFIGIMDEMFYKILRFQYHGPIKKVGPAMDGVGYKAYPFILDIESYLNDDRYKGYLEYIYKTYEPKEDEI